MKIAIPTDDGFSIAPHFGRTRAFRIVEIDDNKRVLSEEIRSNTFTGHAKGDHEEHQHDHNANHQQHSHTSILSALGDCQVVIANGMGRRLFNDLQAAEIQTVMTDEVNITNVLIAFMNNTLESKEELCCNH